MSNNNQGKEYSYWQLLSDQRIEIPIIQRDYAQGRRDKAKIRKDFLGALHTALDQETPIKLDFIYGSQVYDAFQPLDGQQRLTTLFLLHWYAASIESTLADDVRNTLSKFTYETRSSSREFCSELVRNKIIIDISMESVSDSIIDSSWFFLSWKKDPTIDAMLRAIDDIHNLFKGMNGIWAKLTSEQTLISFNYVELDNFGLTDDLYIKMNARGKLLTPFENFKAIFHKRIDENEWDSEKNLTDSFACKIDTVWTDLFWCHRKDNRIDASFMRFISTIAMVRIALEKSQDRIKRLVGLQGRPDTVKVEYFHERGYDYLCECLDIYCNVYNENIDLKLDFQFWQHSPDDNIFTALVYEGHTASYTQKVMFYAQTEYLRKIKEFNKDSFSSWMRVIRNIVCRGDAEKTGNRPTIIRSPETFIGVVNLINELSDGCDNIYQHLSTKSIKSSFAKEQIEEERLKANLIIDNEDNKETIFSMEDTNFCQGKIRFALYCTGYATANDTFNASDLNKIYIVIRKHLEEEKISNDFRRGLLTISVDGKYNYYDYWLSWSGAVDANKRCLIDRYRELEYYIYAAKDCYIYKQYIKKLLVKLIDSDLIQIREQFVPPLDMPNWKARLIKEPDLLDNHCKSNYIAIPKNEECCYLLKGKRPRNIESCKQIN